MKRLFKCLPLPLLLLLGLTGFLLWCGLTHGHDWGDDFSAYIMQAISIVEGRPQQFIESNRFTIEQSSRPIGPVAYPWGFPSLLAPVYAISGLNIIALKVVNVVCFLLFLGLIWFGFHKYHSDIWRIAFVCLFALNPSLLRFMDNILSDIPFLFLSTLSVILIGLVIVERYRLISAVCDHLLLGSVIALAFLVRTNGILLLVALSISQTTATLQRAFARQSTYTRCSACLRDILSQTDLIGVRQLSIAILPYASFFIIVLVWTAVLPQGGSSHVSHLGQVTLGSIKHHLLYYIDLPAAFFDGIPFHYLVYGATIPLALMGVFKRYRSDYHIIAYVTLTVLIYVVWPTVEGLRFLFPILPFYLSFVLASLEGGDGFATRTERAPWRTICILPVIVVLFYFGKLSAGQALDNLSQNRESFSGPFVKTSEDMFSFITTNTVTRSTVIFFKPRVMRLLTGRRSIMIDKVDQLWRGDYLCYYRRNDAYNQISHSDIDDLAKDGHIQLVYTNADFEVYRLNESHNTAFYTDGGSATLRPRQ